MKKFLLALSIALALVVTTSCGVKAADDEVVVTLKNDMPLLAFKNVQVYDADTDEKVGDPASKLKMGGKVDVLAKKNSTIYIKMVGAVSGAGYHTAIFDIGDSDEEITLTITNTTIDYD